MRSVAFASILLALGIAGCGDPNAGALFADIQYATRCEMAATPHCGSPVNRDICGIDSGDPCTPDAPNPQLSCNIQESADGTRTLEFNASQGSGFALTISQAIFAPGSTSAGGAGCRVVPCLGDQGAPSVLAEIDPEELPGESALEVSPPVIAVSAPVLGELMVRLRDLDGWLSSGETTLTFSVAFPDRRHFTDCEHAGMDDVYYLNVVVRFASDGTVSETSFSEALLLGDE